MSEVAQDLLTEETTSAESQDRNDLGCWVDSKDVGAIMTAWISCWGQWVAAGPAACPPGSSTTATLRPHHCRLLPASDRAREGPFLWPGDSSHQDFEDVAGF